MLTEKIKIEKNNIMHLCFSFISYLSFGTEIDLVTVFDAILTSRQTREKLQ